MIPEGVLREIQERLDIVEAIGGYITLKKAGRNFKALCPFHPEKTPSFMVYPQKQFFICYGCGAGGDVVSFVMRHEHVEFPEAVRVLAQKAGVKVTSLAGGETRPVNPELYEVHEAAARFYQDTLLKSPEAQPAREYLKKRGVAPSTWEKFSLGYAPNQWDGFLSFAKAQGFAPELLERAGLSIPREGGSGWYDRFRARVIFPIWDARGRVIAFGGRVLSDEAGPKYMNSPETELYIKGKVLYGLHLATSHIREKDFCIVVEGYMDLVSPYNHGIHNVVASMGTSLTPNQVALIRRLTRHVVIVYDGDYAGQMATLRGLDLFLEAQMRVKVAALPGGFDPDSLIRHQGVEAFAQVIQQSQDLFDYKLGLLTRTRDPKDLQGRIQICEEMLPTLKRVSNAIERGDYVKRLSEALRVEETLLWAQLKQVKLDLSSVRATLSASPPAAAAVTAEDLLAGLLVEQPRRICQCEGRLDPEGLRDPDVRQLVAWLLNRKHEGKIPADHRALLTDFSRGSENLANRIARWLAWVDPLEEKDRILDEALERIEEIQRRLALESLKTSIRQSEEAGDEGRTTQLIQEFNHLMKSR